MRLLLILVLLLGGAAPLAAQQRAALQSGTVDLPPGFELGIQGVKDSYMGMIVRADSGLVIHYDIGGMAGTRVTPLSRDAFLWMTEHRVNGYLAYTGLYEAEGRRRIAITIHGDGREPAFTLPANFTADVDDERDVAEFILVTSTYRPTGSPSAP